MYYQTSCFELTGWILCDSLRPRQIEAFIVISLTAVAWFRGSLNQFLHDVTP